MFSKLFKSDGKTSSSVIEMKASSGPMKTLSRIFTFNLKKKNSSSQKVVTAEVTSSGPSKPNHVEETSSLFPIVPVRSYGLPVEAEGKRVHIWNSIFDHVHDFESIINLREVCVMFMELLEGKYVEVMLAQVIGNQFKNLSICWRGGRKDWLKTLVALRILSKASKRSVDNLLGEGLIGRVGINWFSTKDPHYLIKKEMSVLELGASQIGQGRLHQTLRRLNNTDNLPSNIPMKAIIFDELQEHRVVVDLPSIQKAFDKVIEKLGSNITSFLYRTMEKSFETYVNLGKWLAFMPNLQELIVELHGSSLLRSWEETGMITLEPFPKCPHLKRYVEGPKGFGVPFLKEIIKANPTIQEVLVGEIPVNEWKHIGQLIGTLQITKFHSTSIPRNPAMFLARFHWRKQLTTLALWDPQDRWNRDISSKRFFEFISDFENLVDLLVASPVLRDTEWYFFLPKLKHVTWKLFPTFKTLEFLTFVKSLECLALDVSECVDTRQKEKVLGFLKMWGIPSSFPKLRMIQARTQKDGEFGAVWTRGSDSA